MLHERSPRFSQVKSQGWMPPRAGMRRSGSDWQASAPSGMFSAQHAPGTRSQRMTKVQRR